MKQKDDITLTFVREGKPKKLLSFFKEKGYNVNEYEKGIDCWGL